MRLSRGHPIAFLQNDFISTNRAAVTQLSACFFKPWENCVNCLEDHRVPRGRSIDDCKTPEANGTELNVNVVVCSSAGSMAVPAGRLEPTDRHILRSDAEKVGRRNVSMKLKGFQHGSETMLLIYGGGGRFVVFGWAECIIIHDY